LIWKAGSAFHLYVHPVFHYIPMKDRNAISTRFILRKAVLLFAVNGMMQKKELILKINSMHPATLHDITGCAT